MFPTRVPAKERGREIENACAAASPTAADLGDVQAPGGLIGFRPRRRDGAGRAACLDGRTQGGGRVGSAKGLDEDDAGETVALRPDDGQPAVVPEEEPTQVAGQFRPGLDRVGMIRERPELHEIPRAVGPGEGRGGWRLLQPRRRLSRGRGPHCSPARAVGQRGWTWGFVAR